MNKQEILERLRELAQTEFSPNLKEEVSKLSDVYREVIEQEYHEAQLDKLEGKEVNEEQKEAIKQSVALNKEFKAISADFKQKENEWKARKDEILKEKLQKKSELIERLKFVNNTDDYLPIKEKYELYNDIKKEWDELGQLFSEEYRNLKNLFNQEVQVFYHKVEIDKELRDMDFDKNKTIRQSIIDKVKNLKDEKQIWKTDAFLKMYRQEWEDAGRVKNDDFEVLKNEFFEAYKTVSEKIKAFYAEKDKRDSVVIKEKEALIEKVKELNANVPNQIKQWNELTDKVLQTINEWRKTGFISRKKNQDIWENFSKELDVFFEKKRDFFKVLKEKRKDIRNEKEAIINRITELVNDPGEWNKSTEEVKSLHQKWKEIGRLRVKEEDILWGKLRDISDKFFENKKKHFEALFEQKSELVKEKKDWLKEFENLSLSGEKDQDLQTLAEWQQKWMAFENADPASEKSLNGQFRKIQDKFYAKLDIGDKEKAIFGFKQKVERLKQDDRAKELLENEKRFVKNKLKEAEADLAKLEDGLALFAGKGSNDSPLLKDAKSKVENARKQKMIWEEKWTLLKPVHVKEQVVKKNE